MSLAPPCVIVHHSAPVDIPHVIATTEPIKYINREMYISPNSKKMSVVLTSTARSLINMFEDLPIEEILLLENIMFENEEKDVDCWLIDQITNWVYEDTEILMPVQEAYRLVRQGIFNE